jgi:rRNA biogenesis protein RRP5
VDTEEKKVEMTFRSGDLKRDNTSSPTLADLHEGQKIDGRIKKVEEYGLFIEMDGSKLSGLCHKSEVRLPQELLSSLVFLIFHY